MLMVEAAIITLQEYGASAFASPLAVVTASASGESSSAQGMPGQQPSAGSDPWASYLGRSQQHRGPSQAQPQPQNAAGPPPRAYACTSALGNRERDREPYNMRTKGIIANLGWNASVEDLKCNAAYVFKLLKIPDGELLSVKPTYSEAGDSSCDFKLKAPGLLGTLRVAATTAKIMMRTDADADPVWIDCKKTADELRPLRLVRKCATWVQQHAANEHSSMPISAECLCPLQDLARWEAVWLAIGGGSQPGSGALTRWTSNAEPIGLMMNDSHQRFAGSSHPTLVAKPGLLRPLRRWATPCAKLRIIGPSGSSQRPTASLGISVPLKPTSSYVAPREALARPRIFLSGFDF
jgi:hypothetical protein